MDTKSLHTKHPKKMKPSKDKHEVFVLPPDLLKKLGISIGNINSSQVISPDVNNFPNSEVSNTVNIPASTDSPKPSETSILETASLMKKSVFLSPTFIPTVANVIPGEVELLSNKNIEETFIATDLDELRTPILIPEVNNKVVGVPDSSDILEQCYTVGPDQHNTTLNGGYTSVSNVDVEYPDTHVDGNEIQEDCNNSSLLHNPQEIVKKVNNVEGVYNEDLLKDNCNMELIATGRNSACISSNDVDMENPAPKTSKINIISEETIPLSKLKELKRSKFSNTNKLTPVTVHTIIDTKMKNANRQNTKNLDPFKKVEISHSNELESEENVNKSNPQLNNESILTNPIPGVKSLQGIDELTSNSIEKIIEAEKAEIDIQKEPRGKDSEVSSKSKIIEVPADCQINGHDSFSEDNTPANFESVSGLDTHGDAVVIGINTMTTETCNGQTDDEMASYGKEILPEVGSKCDSDNVEKSTDKQEETVTEKIVTDKVNQNTEKHEESSNLKQTCDKDGRVKNKSSKKGENKLVTMLNETKNLSSSSADIKVDKVKEIAAYLRKFSHIYTDKKKTKTALKNDIKKKEAINSNVNMTESKLCIQGVEKPGGANIDSERPSDCKVLKTYTRRNPPKVSSHTPIICKTETTTAIDSQEHTLHTVNILTSNQTQQFCLCFDFGELSYYDHDNLYEHIHFWYRRSANGERDVIFSIYNDDIEVKNETLVDTEEKTDENDETCHVCWNIYDKEYSDHVDNCDNGNVYVPSLEAKYVTHDVKKADSVDTPQVSVLDNESPKENMPKEIDQGESTNNLNVAGIVETMDGIESTEVAVVTAAESDSISPSTSTSRRNSIKRKLSTSASITSDEPSLKKNIKCGVCNGIFSAADWDSHVETQHDLIAWKAGTTLNLDDPDLKKKLKEKIKSVGLQRCSLCSMEFKKFTRFIQHVQYCIQNKEKQKPEKATRKSRMSLDEKVTCGVCQKTLLSSMWLEHIGRTHDYLAWIDGQDTLNVESESDVRQHLQKIIRANGKLSCYKCGLERSRPKLYLEHVKSCDGTGIPLDETSTSIDLDCSSIQSDSVPVEESTEAATVKCGVCQNDVANSEWVDHICKEHKYLAWRDGETPLNLDDEELVCEYLKQFIRQNGGLTCHKCGLVRKRAKLYLAHVDLCDGSGLADNSLANTTLNTTLNTTTQSTDEWFEVPVEADERKVVKCGVCTQEVPILDWIKHIGKEHDYLAWRDGCTPLDLEDELAVKSHLLDVSRQAGGLMCNKCEKIIKYPKIYVQHIKECTSAPPDSSKLDTSSTWLDLFSQNKIKDEILTCGVCANKIESALWLKHIETDHQYLAWVDGDTPIDKDDAAMVQKHLNDVSKMLGGLICPSCGLKRKYVKSYLAHIEVCEKRDSIGGAVFTDQEIVECARCSEKMPRKAFRKHAMKEHYNIAWVVGDHPIDLNNQYAVESYLKEYHHANNKLVCKVCRISRVSYVGFYAHILICGKTEEEADIYKNVCDLCHNKYLIIYKSQHMTMHREREYALERKQLALQEQELKKEEPVEVIQTGRRKAAEKAKTVIEKYKNCLQRGSFQCSKCGFNSDIESELTDHVCIENKWMDASDSDESVKLENCSDEESEESDVDSNVSDEEKQEREQSYTKKKFSPDTSYKETSKVNRIPYPINDISKYMKRSTEEFIETYLTEEELFPQWRHCEIEEVLENDLVDSMPPIEESCKVRFDENKDWVTFKRLEAERVKDGLVLFLGASIQCISWAPAPASAASQYLAAATHRHADAPRIGADTTHSGPGLLQIWDCGNVIGGKPRFALGLVHDYGTVWSIDWCPSGVRDADEFIPEPNRMHRLGLLAAACSNGAAYIFVVLYPSSITQKENPFYKLKPVVELRLVSNENRKVYQATAVKWSMQKGHSHVVVGYADGTTAYYDLNGNSPLLRTTDNNMTVFYPYHDERALNSCIEDVDIQPSGAAPARGGGAVIGVIEMIPLGSKRKRQNDELSMIVEPLTYSESVKKYGIEYKKITTKDRKIQQKLSATPRDAYPERYPLSDVADLQFCHTFKLHHKLTVAMHAGLIFIVDV
uniref:C2H2-type domain-containing protein n=1 Tax=Heliothis virescens TaxID=7102 RepID=A0A2A4JFN3_HELVI